MNNGTLFICPEFILGSSPLIFNIKICEKTNSKVDSVLLMSQVQRTTLTKND